MPLAKEKKYTSGEFFRFTQESDTERYELLGGDIVALAAPSLEHQNIALGIASELRDFIKKKKGSCRPFISPTDVKLDDSNVVQPDVFVVCDPDKTENGKICDGAPDWIVEITSSNRSRDYDDKLVIYKNSGVREYWIVDTQKKRTLVYFWDTSDSPNIYTFEQDIPVGIFENELTVCISSAASF